MLEKANSLLINTPKSINLFTNIQAINTKLLTGQVPTNLPLYIIGKNVDPSYLERVCLSCGRDISHQNKKSIFCSAKFVGYEQAHQCRNQASNPKNNLLKKIEYQSANNEGIYIER